MMQFIPSLSPEDAQSVVPLGVALIGFLLFWFTFHSEALRQTFHDRMEHDQACLWHIFTAKAWGFVTMGVMPVSYTHLTLPTTPYV